MKIAIGLLHFVFSIAQYHCSSERPYYTFRCHKDLGYDYFVGYIPDVSFCDGIMQCTNWEDEVHGCNLFGDGACGMAKFSCDDGQCKNVTVRCNTINDCKDGTDEFNCGDEVNVKNCTSDDKFLCKDGLRCLGFEYTCDGACNCFDCSDEDDNCSKTDYDLLKKCPHAYFQTTKGPQCVCELNTTSSSKLCDEIGECASGHFKGCEQRCIYFKSKRQCSCYEGYHLIEGICRTTENFVILYANANEIKSLNNTSMKTSTILNGITNCTVLTAANNYVYYATLFHNNSGSIYKASLNSGEPERLIETDFAITSISVDYITNNVYFTNNGSLSVCTNDGQTCTQLKCCNMSSLTLAPKSGWMFYTLLAEPEALCPDGSFLMRSNMDGSNETICTRHCFGGEIYIEMDESKNMLYLLERIDMMLPTLYNISIDCAFQEANIENTFIFVAGRTQNFSFYDGEIFFTMYETPGIFYTTKEHLKNRISFIKHYSTKLYLNDTSTLAVVDLHVHNAAIQHSVENPCDKSTCSGLCLLKPQVQPSLYFLNHTCLFPTNNTLTKRLRGTVWMVTWMLALLALFILAGTGYYIFKKCNWYGYYLAFQPRNMRRSESQHTMIFKNQGE